jgi:beta-ribofuranosylaminobenzene 5'-phosphate synthase
MTAAVHLCAPCRLHFGMFSFGRSDRAEFGGVGVMVEPPNVAVDITLASKFQASGSHAERVRRFVNDLTKRWELESLPECIIEVKSPPDHSGLGVGTQLGLTVAAGLRRFLQLPEVTVEQLAASVGRARRSAVGTYGFEYGGLIVDAGKHHGAPFGQLFKRLELPAEWRFVLVQDLNARGLAGTHEAEAFAALPPVPEEITRKLWQIVTDGMIPAVESARCADFGEALYEFGRFAGECFAPVQGGPFASPRIEHRVNAIRKLGVAGVGQSSWGPTVYAVVPTETDAGRLVKHLREDIATRDCDFTIAAPNNTGATICA